MYNKKYPDSENKLYYLIFMYFITGTKVSKSHIDYYLTNLNLSLSKRKYLQIRKNLLPFIYKYLPEAIFEKKHQYINFQLLLTSIVNYYEIPCSQNFLAFFKDKENSLIFSDFKDHSSKIISFLNSLREFPGINNFLIFISLTITYYFSILNHIENPLIEESFLIKSRLYLQMFKDFSEYSIN